MNSDQPLNKFDAVLARVVGGALGCFGLAGVALFAYFAYAVVGNRRLFEPGVLAFLTGLAAISWFCISVGFRLLLNRPNAYNSVLSPLGWGVLGTLFAAGGLAFVAIGFSHSMRPLLAGITGSAVFAVACFVMRSRINKRARHAL